MSATVQRFNADIEALCDRIDVLVERLEARCGIRQEVEPKPRPKLTLIRGSRDA